jgi:hypothetical protein
MSWKGSRRTDGEADARGVHKGDGCSIVVQSGLFVVSIMLASETMSGVGFKTSRSCACGGED